MKTGGEKSGNFNSYVSAAGDAISDIGDKLVDKGADLVDEAKDRGKKIIDDTADLAARGSEKLADVSEQVRNTDIQGFVSSAKDYASRNPMFFAGIAAVAGLALGLFMSSSGSRTRS